MQRKEPIPPSEPSRLEPRLRKREVARYCGVSAGSLSSLIAKRIALMSIGRYASLSGLRLPSIGVRAMARTLYSPAQVAQIAERGRRDGWSTVRVEQSHDRIVIEFFEQPRAR